MLVDLVTCQYTDGAISLATGTGLQYATTGVLAQFTITAIDESGLRRTLGGDDFIVELDGTRTLSGSVSAKSHGFDNQTYYCLNAITVH